MEGTYTRREQTHGGDIYMKGIYTHTTQIYVERLRLEIFNCNTLLICNITGLVFPISTTLQMVGFSFKGYGRTPD